jgi:hypothetical protein
MGHRAGLGTEEHRLRVLKRIFEPKKEAVTRGWRKIHNEELQNLYVSPNIVGAIKSRSTRCTRH